MFEWVWDRQRKKMSWEHKALQGLGERRSRSRDYYPMKKGFIWCYYYLRGWENVGWKIPILRSLRLARQIVKHGMTCEHGQWRINK